MRIYIVWAFRMSSQTAYIFARYIHLLLKSEIMLKTRRLS